MSLCISHHNLRRHTFNCDFNKFDYQDVVGETQTSCALYHKNGGAKDVLLEISQVIHILEALHVDQS